MSWDVQSTWTTIQNSSSVVTQPSSTESLATVTSPADQTMVYALHPPITNSNHLLRYPCPGHFLNLFGPFPSKPYLESSLFHIYIPCFYRHTSLIRAALTAMDSYTELDFATLQDMLHTEDILLQVLDP